MTTRSSRSFTRESSEFSNRSYTDYDTDSVRRRWRLSPSPRPRSLTPAEVEDILSQDQYTGYTYGDSISYRSDGAEEFLHPYLNQRRHVDFSTGAGDVSNYRLASGKRVHTTHGGYKIESSYVRVTKTISIYGDRVFQRMKRIFVVGANDVPSMLRSRVDKISHLFPMDDEKRAKKLVPLLLFLLLFLGLGIAANRNSRQLKAYAQNSVDYVKDQTTGIYNSIATTMYGAYEKTISYPRAFYDFVKNQSSGVYNSITSNAYGAYVKINQLISGSASSIYDFFYWSSSWTSGFISGFYGRVKDIGNAANINNRQLKAYAQNSVDYVKDQTTGIYNSIATTMYGAYEKTISYPRAFYDFVKNQSSGVYNSITSNAYGAYVKINQLISGSASSIYNFFYWSSSWISGFISGFYGRLKYNLDCLHRPDWMNLGLFYKPVELTSDFANYVYRSVSNFFHFIYLQTVSMIPERKSVEKVIVHEHHHEYKPEPVPQQPIIQQVIVPTVDTDAIRKLIRESIEQYDADKTGQPDYALETSGAEVIGIGCTKVYEEKSRLQYMFGLPLYYSNYGPRTIIQRKSNSIIPGECFAFEGEHGEVIIKLSRKINVTAISYEHLPLILSPEGHIKTAPKSFLVWSLQDYHKTGENKKHLLGKFTYDDKGSALQTFYTEFPDAQFTPIIQLETESNYGSPVTCLYRFRVHGQPVETN
ncbi:SUN domain-containing protein [Aphelenchoides besseyi]|nr:SUN domain-containing protein [Aphelenchoides besseyi]KAI6210031.1 SUN domain-containing protein [Aphelenchoides besseyi]